MATNGRAAAVPAYQHVADHLRDRIVSGQLGPGDRLPVETDLGELFGVSRSTVREALRVLASQQLVTTVRGVQGGTFVAHPQAAGVTDYLETSLGLLTGAAQVDVGELIEARELLEVPATRLAAARRTEEHLAALHATLAGRTATFEDNRTFHEIIVDAAGNRLVAMMTRPVFGVLRDRFAREEAPKSFPSRVAADHRKILAALEDGDAEAAADAMSAHLRHLGGTYRRIDRQGRVR